MAITWCINIPHNLVFLFNVGPGFSLCNVNNIGLFEQYWHGICSNRLLLIDCSNLINTLTK